MEFSSHGTTDTTFWAALSSQNPTEARKALALLYKQYSKPLLSYCRRIVSEQVLAEDIVQEVFIKFFDKTRNSGSEIDNIGSYLFRIARNLCINEKNRKRESPLPETDTLNVSIPSAAFSLEQDELLKLIESALLLLPEDLREAFILREYSGLAYNEIADVLQIDLNTVKGRIYRAKNKIRDILAPYLADLSDE